MQSEYSDSIRSSFAVQWSGAPYPFPGYSRQYFQEVLNSALTHDLHPVSLSGCSSENFKSCSCSSAQSNNRPSTLLSELHQSNTYKNQHTAQNQPEKHRICKRYSPICILLSVTWSVFWFRASYDNLQTELWQIFCSVFCLIKLSLILLITIRHEITLPGALQSQENVPEYIMGNNHSSSLTEKWVYVWAILESHTESCLLNILFKSKGFVIYLHICIFWYCNEEICSHGAIFSHIFSASLPPSPHIPIQK